MRMKPSFLALSFLLAWLALPYLFDIAICEELYGASPLQATLTDGETVDSCEGDTLSVSLHWARTTDLGVPPLSQGFFGDFSFETGRVSCPSLPISASRAPPITR
jgi:hypothetical protein